MRQQNYAEDISNICRKNFIVTLYLEALFTTMVIDLYKGFAIAPFNVPGPYLHIKLPYDKNVLLKQRGGF